ncbi:envelope stress response membrane protein PspB [Sphingomonas oleivorans]|uniref:Envelope stress response membrane protein PspB n=1 Tax=Sphingomonas oleivorans TaxID=1735121 RepID=A0A2T5FTJ0_9SPHN|nr:envelope stress response membrane protein PspB [Sphingomonas oleivorans]PTQ07378.1 envelope stress response membrane protein PspB [Sphingomonas oleivorans]
MEEVFVPIAVVGMLFIGLPWLIFHYVSQWKRSGSLSMEDEKLLDELHDLARRLDDRLATIERIMAADDPSWRSRTQAAVARDYRADDEPRPGQEWRRDN